MKAGSLLADLLVAPHPIASWTACGPREIAPREIAGRPVTEAVSFKKPVTATRAQKVRAIDSVRVLSVASLDPATIDLYERESRRRRRQAG